MSDQGQPYDEQLPEGFDDDLADDDPRVAQLEAAVSGLYASQYQDHVGELVADFPEFTSEEGAQRLVQTAAERAQEMGAPHLANDVRHLRHVAADLRVQAQAVAAQPMSDTERFDKFVVKQGGSRVLPFG